MCQAYGRRVLMCRLYSGYQLSNEYQPTNSAPHLIFILYLFCDSIRGYLEILRIQ